MEELKIEPVDDSTVIVSDEESEKTPEKGNEGRKLRKRAGSEDLLHGTRNKVIRKRKDSHSEFKNDNEVKKFYLNVNKNIKVKPILLETIFEELEDEEETVQAKQLGKASKRAITIKNGFDISKTLTNKRKSQIKRKLGNRKKPKKVALKKFMEDFKKKISTSEGDLVE